MRRMKLVIAYDGSKFTGWQQQPGMRTVEGELWRGISELTGESISLIGASRTDSGVHADGNVAVFDTKSPIPPERFFLALNRFLPDDIRAVSSDACALSWHPRHVPAVKTYFYRIWNEKTEHPMHRLYAYHCHFELDIAAMRAAAARLVGTHDFTSFANPASQVLLSGGSAVREIYEISVLTGRDAYLAGCEDASMEACQTANAFVAAADGKKFHGMMTIRVRGNGFLYHMVRILAGTLIRAGMGQYSPADIDAMLLAKDREKAGPTAPAKGLCLHEIRYL